MMELTEQQIDAAKHTPGPWEAFFKHKYNEWHVAVPTSGTSMKLGLFVDGVPTENAEADARLIAAAPDLLAALMAYVAAQGRMLDKWADGDAEVKRQLWKNLHAREENARAAIAKAKGE